MAKQPSERKWLLFKSAKKNDDDPDYRGELMFNGELRGMVGWWNDNSHCLYGYSFSLGNIAEEWCFEMFQNIKKKDSHPDYRGNITINGTVKELVAWLRMDKNNEQFLSGSINPKKVDDLEAGEINGNRY